MQPDFSRKLMKWNRESNSRVMPWKGERDPYKIWLSEIILQQTRVEQGLDYYHAFIGAFPGIRQLAAAPEQKVFKLWEGLGYYSRCKNLVATAKYISNELNGRFPERYEAILALKGVGPYTAAAIASFAFNLPYAVLDGNVFRVLARYFGLSAAIDSKEGKALFMQLAGSLLDKKNPGAYNQAIMDFGAVICKPRQPLCEKCPQKKDCLAFRHNWVQDLPVKEKQLKKKTRWFYYFIVRTAGGILVRKRMAKDIWQNLYEFVLYESDSSLLTTEKALQKVVKQLLGKQGGAIKNISSPFRQQLTHQLISGWFIDVEPGKGFTTIEGYTPVRSSALSQYPFPGLINQYLQQKKK